MRRSRNTPTRQPLNQINNGSDNTEFPGVEDNDPDDELPPAVFTNDRVHARPIDLTMAEPSINRTGLISTVAFQTYTDY